MNVARNWACNIFWHLTVCIFIFCASQTTQKNVNLRFLIYKIYDAISPKWGNFFVFLTNSIFASKFYRFLENSYFIFGKIFYYSCPSTWICLLYWISEYLLMKQGDSLVDFRAIFFSSIFVRNLHVYPLERCSKNSVFLYICTIFYKNNFCSIY